MKKIVLLIAGILISPNLFAEFKDSCIVTYYTSTGGRYVMAHQLFVPVTFYSGYELNKKDSSDEHVENSVIAVIQSDELGNPTAYANEVKVDTKFLTKKELKNGLINSFVTYGRNIMFADDRKAGYWEIILR